MARLLLRPTPMINPLPSDATSSHSHATSVRGLGFGVPWRSRKRFDLGAHSPAPVVITAPPLSPFTASVHLNSRDAEGPSSDPSLLTSSVGSPALTPDPPLQWSFERRHLLFLDVIACTIAISASWLFISAIPTLLAFKRAAESLEKLLDATREELPDTMAAVRLSGMEISDLTMELSDLGQEIGQGIRSSTRAVRLAEDRLRRLTTMSPIASIQVPDAQKNKLEGPPVARAARRLKESIVKGRALLGVFSSVTRFSSWAWKFWANRGQKRIV